MVGRLVYGGAPLTVHLAHLCGTRHGHADALLPYSLEHEDESWWYSEYILNLAAAALYGPHHVLQVSSAPLSARGFVHTHTHTHAHTLSMPGKHEARACWRSGSCGAHAWCG